MGLGLRVRYRATDGAVYGEQVVVRLPVRIGRNALNDCIIAHPYVSEFHGIIELVDGQLGVRDLNSKNGIYLGAAGRVPAGQFRPLGSSGNVFALGPNIHVQVEPFEQDAPAGARQSPVRGAVIGRESYRADPPDMRSAPPPGLPPLPLMGSIDAAGGVASLPPLSMEGAMPLRPPPVHAARPSVPAGMMSVPAESLPPLPALSPGLSQIGGPGEGPRAYAPLPEHGGKRAAHRNTEQFAMDAQALAFSGLKELAASLVPGAELRTTGDVARLVTKLHDTIEVYCRCFVPMRAAHEQFVSQTYLQRSAVQRSINRSESAMRVEGARDAASLASALLDWRSQDYDAPKAVEAIFADITMHYVSLVEGVMRGVQALLDELSPENIERAAAGGGIGGRQKAVWRAFKERHEELSSESRAFELVFGAEFAAVYREFLEREGKPTR
ncbi:MAG TPA: type VI secretion system-associated FHA domain protein [Polyangiaceae bacterium]